MGRAPVDVLCTTTDQGWVLGAAVDDDAVVGWLVGGQWFLLLMGR